MTLGVGEIEAVQSLLGEFVVVFALVTQLGDIWFYFAVLGTWYWLGDRTPVLGGLADRRLTAGLVGLGVGAMALTVALKGAIALDRPPGAETAVAAEAVPRAFRDLYAAAATGDGFGFPSGHAIGTTAIWGGVAWFTRGDGRRRRGAIAAAIVALVGFSRVALGVHYAVSVVAGVVIGAAYLLGMSRFGIDPARTFGVASAFGVVAVAVTGFGTDATVVLGLAVGSLLAWLAVGERVPEHPQTGREALLTALLGLVVCGGLFGATLTLEPPVPVSVVLSALVGAAVLALPVVTRRAERKAVR